MDGGFSKDFFCVHCDGTQLFLAHVFTQQNEPQGVRNLVSLLGSLGMPAVGMSHLKTRCPALGSQSRLQRPRAITLLTAQLSPWERPPSLPAIG